MPTIPPGKKPEPFTVELHLSGMDEQISRSSNANPRRALRMTDTPIHEIVSRVLNGDDAAYEGIMRRYNRLLFRLARAILKDDDEAQDAVQEAYFIAYRQLRQFRGPHGFSSWLSSIARNEALRRLRGRVIAHSSSEALDKLYAIPSLQPENAASSIDTLRLIESAIDRLPPDFRLVFMLRGVEQLSIAETAEHLDLNTATVKTRFHRARVLLRKSLTRQLEQETLNTFGFAGTRCDSIVEKVLERLGLRKGQGRNASSDATE